MVYGNHRGKVKLHGSGGLCKVFVPAVYPSEYENQPSMIPWCEPAQPLSVTGRDGIGVFQYPDIESTVWVFFEGGDINHPVMFCGTLGSGANFQSGKRIIQTKKYKITIDDNADPAVLIAIDGNVTATINGDLTANVDGDLSATITGSSAITCPTTVITGDVTVVGTISGTTVLGETITASGALTGLSVTAGVLDLGSHVHMVGAVESMGPIEP